MKTYLVRKVSQRNKTKWNKLAVNYFYVPNCRKLFSYSIVIYYFHKKLFCNVMFFFLKNDVPNQMVQNIL